MKNCAWCGKQLNSSQSRNIYCSQKCANLAKRNKKITNWQNGEFNGNMVDGQISKTIRNYMLEKANYKCELCGWGEINPVTFLVPLEIHHVDGNYLNNSEDNLQVLCPNCHSLTPNFKALNKSERKRTTIRKKYCIDCGVEISSNAIRCIQCNGKIRITDKPINREELKNLIRTIPFTKIGEQFNVTDNTIRKWCIGYNLPSKKRDINNYSDEEWNKI